MSLLHNDHSIYWAPIFANDEECFTLSTLNSYFHRGSIEALEHPGLDRQHQEACRLSTHPSTHFSRPRLQGLWVQEHWAPQVPFCISPPAHKRASACAGPGSVEPVLRCLLCPCLQAWQREAVVQVTLRPPTPHPEAFSRSPGKRHLESLVVGWPCPWVTSFIKGAVSVIKPRVWSPFAWWRWSGTWKGWGCDEFPGSTPKIPTPGSG